MNAIAKYRKQVGLTQVDMAKKLNISEGTYRKKEKGYSNFKDYEVVIFREVLKSKGIEVSISDIFLILYRRKNDELKEAN